MFAVLAEVDTLEAVESINVDPLAILLAVEEAHGLSEEGAE